MSFSLERRIRFADVDPAGIVFYPRYFEMINETVEDWFGRALGYGFDEMIRRDGFGVPLANINVDFKSPSHLDDSLTFSLTVTEIGRSAIRLQIVADCDSEVRLIANLVLVYIETGRHKPVAIPPELKSRMLTFTETAQ